MEWVTPVLEGMAAEEVRPGGRGAGPLANAVNQVIVGLHLRAVAEAPRWE